jgi:hypothetical protein
MSDEHETPEELRKALRKKGLTEQEVDEVVRIATTGVTVPRRRLAVVNEHVPTRESVGEAPVDPLIAFYWARLDERQARADVLHGEELADVRAKKAILDDYARYCADLDNPAREMICQVSRDVIKRLATVYDGHPDYTEDFRP